MVTVVVKGHHILRRDRGFTIVELLIVIIVIAILAAIVVVADNGIQQKANNTQTIESIAAYTRVLHSYAIQNTYPINTGYPCLGPAGTTCANVTSTAITCYGAGSAGYVASFDAAVHTMASSLPGPSAQRISCGSDSYAGVYYHSAADGMTASIVYFLVGSPGCGAPGGLTITGSSTQGAGTQCRGDLPAL